MQHKTIEQLKQTLYRTTGCLSKIEKTDVSNPGNKGNGHHSRLPPPQSTLHPFTPDTATC